MLRSAIGCLVFFSFVATGAAEIDLTPMPREYVAEGVTIGS
jgi:hypothetical protein